MNTFKTIATIAFAASAALFSLAASAQAVNGNPGYVQDIDGNVVRAGSGECLHTGTWTPANATIVGCDGVQPPKPVAPPPPPPPPAPVVVAPPPPPVPTSEKVTFAAETLFDFDKSVLKPEGKEVLTQLVTKLKDVNLEAIVATGHTDSIGTVEYNQKLSVRRAEAVKAFLVSAGIPADRVYTSGKGKSQPVADNKTAAGRAKNRRVEIEIVGTRTINK